MTRISQEQLHQAYRSDSFAGREDVSAFEMRLEQDAQWFEFHRHEYGLHPGIRHIEQYNAFQRTDIGIVHSVVLSTDTLQVSGFGNLIAMKNIFPYDVFAILETRVYVRDEFRGIGNAQQLLAELYAKANEIHKAQHIQDAMPTLIVETLLVPDTSTYKHAKARMSTYLLNLGAKQIIADDKDFFVTVLVP